MEQLVQDIKNPVSWMTWGGDLRLRNEYFDNAESLSPDNRSKASALHEQDYFRFRARIYTAITPFKDLTVNARVATEPREWLNPAAYTTYKGHSGLDWQYGIIDNLNVQWRNILNQPATFTVGRQELNLNDNWLTGDGTPNDGSATAFLDMARLTYDLKDQQTTIDLIGILQYARDNTWLPIINGGEERLLADQNEKGAILNISNKSIKQANLDGYFIYKHDDRLNNPIPANISNMGDNADIYTVGGRLSGLVFDHWKYSAEGAYQFGEKQDPSLKHDDSNGVNQDFRDIDAFGFNSKAAYLFNDCMSNQVGIAYEYLSGDNPGTTGKDEMFDVLWGRYPRFNELQNIYSYIFETRVAQIANLQRVGPTWAITPMRNMDFSASYFALFADQKVPTRANLAAAGNVFTDTGSFRGHSIQTLLKYRFSQHLSGHLQGELLFPGDYYVSRNTMAFARAELNFSF